MTNFKVGDRVRTTKDCAPIKAGEVYDVKNRAGGKLYIGDFKKNSYCECSDSWQLIEKTIETLEVGDWVQKDDFYRYVLAVLHRNGEKTIYILSQACNQPDEKDHRSKCTSVDVTAFELKKNNWTTHNSPSPLTEITAEDAINEIAKQRGVDPESIRIKK